MICITESRMAKFSWSVKAGPGVRTPWQLLPLTEGGYYGAMNCAIESWIGIDTMNCAIEAKDAIYFFIAEEESDMVHVTKIVRKGCKGYDQGTKVSTRFARTWYNQLCNAWWCRRGSTPLPGITPSGDGYRTIRGFIGTLCNWSVYSRWSLWSLDSWLSSLSYAP